jgi:hypothetical protein
LFADVVFYPYHRRADTGVLSLAPLKRLALNAQVISSEPHPQPPSTKPAAPQAEEVLVSAAAAEASITPPPPVPAAAFEEGEATTRVSASREALVTSTEAGPSGENVVVVLSEDSVALPSSENCDVVIPPASESAQVEVTASLLPAMEVSVPSPAVEVSGPSPSTEVAETSSFRVALTAEEVIELATCRYINFPGVGVIDLEAPQLPEKVYEVVAERMFNEPTIMETIASVSKALQEYECADGFAPAVAEDATETALAASEAHVGSSTDAPAPPSVNEGREASPPQLVETAEAPALVTEADAAEAVVGEEGSSPPRPVAVEAEGVETCMPGEPATIMQQSADPETMTRAVSPKIREAEETGASLSQAQQAARPGLLTSRALRGR